MKAGNTSMLEILRNFVGGGGGIGGSTGCIINFDFNISLNSVLTNLKAMQYHLQNVITFSIHSPGPSMLSQMIAREAPRVSDFSEDLLMASIVPCI